jgi:sugar phosphate isomerase/epimerase
VSGGWCDFYQSEPEIDRTLASVERQVAIARALDVRQLRLFYGWLPAEKATAAALDRIVTNLTELSARYPDMLFAFENHDGASLCPSICRQILAAVDRQNIRMNFDPVNFERAGVDSAHALNELAPFIAHVHLKGLQDGEYCEFGEGTLNLVPVIRRLLETGYRGGFTDEYEGRFDRTLRLYRSLRRARAVIAELTSESTRS